MKKIDKKSIEQAIIEYYTDNDRDMLMLPLRGADALRIISLEPVHISNDDEWKEVNYTRGRPSISQDLDTYQAWTVLGSSLERWDSEEE